MADTNRSYSRRAFVKSAAAATVLSQIASIREAGAATIKLPAANDDSGWLISPDQYSLDSSVTYLNHASIGTTPRVVQEALYSYQKLCETNPWLYMWSDPWNEPREQVRSQTAELFRCAIDEVAIVHNTTEVFNTLAHGLPIKTNEEVLYSSLNHVGASVCWQRRAAEKGFTVRQFDFPIADVEHMTVAKVVALYEAQIKPETVVLALPHIDNMVGLRHPLKEIAAMAHAKGVRWVVVDGAQTAGMIPLDLAASGVDVYATSAHKWIQSPKGLGLAYISAKVQADLAPMWVTWGQKRWAGTARVFEDYGTRALPAVLALGDALTFQSAIPAEDRHRHHLGLWNAMQEMADGDAKLAFRSPREWSVGGALYSIETKGKNSGEVATTLYEESGIVVRPFAAGGVHTIRISPNLANGVAELEKIVGAIGAM